MGLFSRSRSSRGLYGYESPRRHLVIRNPPVSGDEGTTGGSFCGKSRQAICTELELSGRRRLPRRTEPCLRPRRWALCPVFGADLPWRPRESPTQGIWSLRLPRPYGCAPFASVVAADAARHRRLCTIVPELSGFARIASVTREGSGPAYGYGR